VVRVKVALVPPAVRVACVQSAVRSVALMVMRTARHAIEDRSMNRKHPER